MIKNNTYTPELPNLSWVMSLKVNSFNTSKNCRLVGGSSSCFSFWTEVSPFLRLYMIPSLQNMARKGCQLINGQPPSVVLLYEVVITFESLDEISERYHSDESYWAVLSCGTFYYAVQGGSNFWVCGWNPEVWPFKWKLLSSTFLWYCLLWCTRWFLLLSL